MRGILVIFLTLGKKVFLFNLGRRSRFTFTTTVAGERKEIASTQRYTPNSGENRRGGIVSSFYRLTHISPGLRFMYVVRYEVIHLINKAVTSPYVQE